MECNKDEAARAKEIAEKKVKEKDYAGAKKFALKAQNLYPGLEGLDQMLTTIGVYISAENKVNGEVDWYKVLDVNPGADDETIKRQYRKLALLLHPDKNKSVCADGAFNLVSEAWTCLSDKARRLTYNQRTQSRGLQQKFPMQSGVSAVPPRANGSHNSSNNVASNARTYSSQNWMGPASVTPPADKKPATFWTLCNRCKTQFEYLRIYLNHNLLCPNCKKPFLAVEKAPPSVYVPSNSSRQQQQNSGHHAANSNSFNYGSNSSVAQTGHAGLTGHSSSNNTSFQWGSYSRMSGINSTVGSTSVAAEAAHVIQQAQEKVKRDREEAQAAAGWAGNNTSYRMGNSNLKRRKDDIRFNGNVGGMATQMAVGSGPGQGSVSESRRSILETQGIYRLSGIYQKPKSERELLSFELRSMLVDRARTEICQKLHEWRSVAEAKNAEKEKARERESKRNKGVLNNDTHGVDKHVGPAVANQGKKSPPNSSPDDLEAEAPALMSINVPDPDFHNFDLDRTEVSFAEDQVWAAYDGDDGMPRYYARIHKVISLKPFKMKISWLNSRSNNELGPLDWIGSGFSKTCGEFRAGRHEMNETLNFFSHKVHWTKGIRGVIRIYPQKGDVWALYRNWSSDWNENTPKDVIHKYDMVEVLDDFNEERGVLVAPLIKVGSFRTVFRKNEDPKETRRIPKAELFCLSHQVPNYLLTGQEAHNSPVGCRELDPAATPLELLQVINEAGKAPGAGNSQKTEEAVSQGASKMEVDEIAKDFSKAKGEVIEEDNKPAEDDHSTALPGEA
ncbi:hypothetical protein SLEP1_g40007 [Rubroshorea leprosula]|uniref:J domain-containing protein n=1 Tax=Rubroshorea leprosula TaxID=152421 RepID=A0AAV5L2B0_9ROSI|nr:hypothetical protein SLEP1_g40007 [Rubroshorea leprosula]